MLLHLELKGDSEYVCACVYATNLFICYVICQPWHCVSVHILHGSTVNYIWGTCTCTQSISRGAAYICSSLINSMQNVICQLHCHRLQRAACVSRDWSGGILRSQQASLTPPPKTSVAHLLLHLWHEHLGKRRGAIWPWKLLFCFWWILFPHSHGNTSIAAWILLKHSSSVFLVI